MNETETAFEEFDTDLSSVNDGNLFSKIWTTPSDTLKYILHKCPEKHVTILLILGGIVRAIGRASNKGMGDNMSTIAVLGIATILGGLMGCISYYIYAWALSLTGAWLEGEANSSKFRTIIAWASVPSICSLILLIPELIILGDDLFRSEPLHNTLTTNVSWVIFGVMELVLGIWSIVILVKGISIIQNFGIGKSILNMILPGLLLLMLILVIVLIMKI